MKRGLFYQAQIIQNYRGEEMNTEKVIIEVERTIKKVCKDIKKRQGSVGCDKLDSLSKLINSYSRLIERANEPEEKEKFDRSAYIDALMQSAE